MVNHPFVRAYNAVIWWACSLRLLASIRSEPTERSLLQVHLLCSKTGGAADNGKRAGLNWVSTFHRLGKDSPSHRQSPTTWHAGVARQEESHQRGGAMFPMAWGATVSASFLASMGMFLYIGTAIVTQSWDECLLETKEILVLHVKRERKCFCLIV